MLEGLILIVLGVTIVICVGLSMWSDYRRYKRNKLWHEENAHHVANYAERYTKEKAQWLVKSDRLNAEAREAHEEFKRVMRDD